MQHQQHVVNVSDLPKLNLRDPEFVRHVIEGMKGPFVDNVVTDCVIRVTNDVFERKRQGIDIQDLAWRLAGKHDPKQFKASTSVRLHGDPSGTYLLFPSECMVMTGVRCPELVLTAALRIARLYSHIYGRVCRLEAYNINNVHGVIMMGYPLDLNLLHEKLPNSYRQPTNIKCVIFRLNVPLRKPTEPRVPPMGHMLLPTAAPDFGSTALQPINPEDAVVVAAETAAQQAKKKKKQQQKTKTKKRKHTETLLHNGELDEELNDVNVVPNKSTTTNAKKKRKLKHESHRGGGIYTVANLETQTLTTKTITTTTGGKSGGGSRKRPKNPNHVAVNVWESGKVVMLGRSEEHLIDAAIQLGELLAQVTMNKKI